MIRIPVPRVILMAGRGWAPTRRAPVQRPSAILTSVYHRSRANRAKIDPRSIGTRKQRANERNARSNDRMRLDVRTFDIKQLDKVYRDYRRRNLAFRSTMKKRNCRRRGGGFANVDFSAVRRDARTFAAGGNSK